VEDKQFVEILPGIPESSKRCVVPFPCKTRQLVEPLNAFTQCLFTEADKDDGGDEEDDIGDYEEEGKTNETKSPSSYTRLVCSTRSRNNRCRQPSIHFCSIASRSSINISHHKRRHGCYHCYCCCFCTSNPSL
jgi:hypothetical protein